MRKGMYCARGRRFENDPRSLGARARVPLRRYLHEDI